MHNLEATYRIGSQDVPRLTLIAAGNNTTAKRQAFHVKPSIIIGRVRDADFHVIFSLVMGSAVHAIIRVSPGQSFQAARVSQ